MASVKERLAAYERRCSGVPSPPAKGLSIGSSVGRLSCLGVQLVVPEDQPMRAPPMPLQVRTPESAQTPRGQGVTPKAGGASWRISSGISPSTPRNTAPVVDAASTYELTTAFKSFDFNSDGMIDARELEGALVQLLGGGAKEEVRGALRVADRDGDDKISLAEFSQLAKHIQTRMRELEPVAAKPKPPPAPSVLKVHGAHGGTHSFAEEEKAAFSSYINGALGGDEHLARVLPIEPSTLELFRKVNDGVLLCKLVNHASEDEAIDERAVNIPSTVGGRAGPKLSRFQIGENLNLAIGAARAVGCHIVNIDNTDILQGTPHLVLGMVWQLVRLALLKRINLRAHPELAVLAAADESVAELHKLPPEQVLLRWLNWHLERAGREERVRNFGRDLSDSLAYTVVLSRIADARAASALRPLSEPDARARAEAVVSAASAMEGVSFSITADDILNANEKLNMAFVAALFNAAPGLDEADISAAALEGAAGALGGAGAGAGAAPGGAGGRARVGAVGVEMSCGPDGLTLDESREERAFRMWINSLGIGRFIFNLFDDLQDSIAVLQVMDKLKPGLVSWGPHVATNPRTVYETAENGNYVISLATDERSGFALSLVGIQGADLAEGNRMYILAVIWQLMRFHVLNYIRLSVGAPVSEEDVLRWANQTVAKGGSGRRIESFKDRTLKTGLFLLDLVKEVDERSVDTKLIKRVDFDLIYGANLDDCALNAKYAISCARKLGCAVFLLWEDIVEVRPKLIFTFVAAVMAEQLDRANRPAPAAQDSEPPAELTADGATAADAVVESGDGGADAGPEELASADLGTGPSEGGAELLEGSDAADAGAAFAPSGDEPSAETESDGAADRTVSSPASATAAGGEPSCDSPPTA